MDRVITDWRRYILVQPPMMLLVLAMSMSGNTPIFYFSKVADYIYIYRYHLNRSDSIPYMHYNIRNKQNRVPDTSQ